MAFNLALLDNAISRLNFAIQQSDYVYLIRDCHSGDRYPQLYDIVLSTQIDRWSHDETCIMDHLTGRDAYVAIKGIHEGIKRYIAISRPYRCEALRMQMEQKS